MKKLAAVVACFGVLISSNMHAAGIEDKYNKACVTCHGTGALGAPKTGDQAAWAPRLKQGTDTLLSHIRSGYKNMPAKGLCNDCSDADYIALIKFMSQ
ncbi:c-type cytochrome [Agitococcus lubricus]|uniref:Cbb3-type cytochrome c oxidase subunit III n=1 Tax=Agitococcus lubricus TaxID=1077255 RepID=A0A2T5IY31_9GAMM|nr:c-type cytochrome [Agitococcus lubricus]PTQ88886.1 cbb3-type cytochrome c oxidase subunit III [Agitococcus lubricus]